MRKNPQESSEWCRFFWLPSKFIQHHMIWTITHKFSDKVSNISFNSFAYFSNKTPLRLIMILRILSTIRERLILLCNQLTVLLYFLHLLYCKMLPDDLLKCNQWLPDHINNGICLILIKLTTLEYLSLFNLPFSIFCMDSLPGSL